MAHKFIIADVFTTTPFGGNPLAVFPDATGISDADMQAFAREINFTETTFVLPPREPQHAFRVRIFSPQTELPFAGHPTVGTAAVLRGIGRIAEDVDTVVLEEGIGPVSVFLRPGPGPIFGRMILSGKVDQPSSVPTRKAAAEVLSLPDEEVLDIWCGGAGVGFNFVHLKDKASVDRAVLNRSAWTSHLKQSWSPHLYLFSGDLAPGGNLYARMFGPALGFEEDPATGAACAGLAGTLALRHGDADGVLNWIVEQGISMGRPSRMEASARKEGGRLTSIEVGGPTVIIGEGAMTASLGS